MGPGRVTTTGEGSMTMVEFWHCLTQGSLQLLARGVGPQGRHGTHFLREGAEDGSGQSHHHGRGLDDDGGVLALPDTGLIAAAGQGSRATGPAWHTLAVAGHVLGLEVHLGERDRRK